MEGIRIHLFSHWNLVLPMTFSQKKSLQKDFRNC